MATKHTERRQVATAEWIDNQDGEKFTGTVVKQNGSTIYVKWAPSGRVEPIARRDTRGVTFKTADES